MGKYRFIFLLFVTVIFSLNQFLNIGVFGAKPNLALVAVVVSIFFTKNFKEAFLIIVLGALILKFSPEATSEIILFIILGAASAFLARILPWNHILNCLILIGLTTTVFYVAIGGGFNLLLSSLYLKEVVYNLIIAGGLFYFYKLVGIEALQISRLKLSH